LVAPDPERWLRLDEQERIALVLEYHRRIRAPLSHAQRDAHATMHAVIENQIAAGEPPVTARAVARLIGQGLDRHEALHAVTAVLIGQIDDALRHGIKHDPAKYEAELDRLTPETWRRDFG
jgi:hypothetical protein